MVDRVQGIESAEGSSAYASEHLGVAVLEKLAWLGSYRRARESSFLLLPLQFDPDEHLQALGKQDLPDSYDAFPHPEATRDLGTRGFEEDRSAVLAVPSAILPISKNYLVNPFPPNFHE